MKKTIDFIIKTTGSSKINKSKAEKSKPENFTITYDSFNHDLINIYQIEKHVLLEHDKEHMFDEISEKIVNDWIRIETTKENDYIFGLENLDWKTIFSSKEAKDSLEKIVLQSLKQFFNPQYISGYDRQNHKYLFEIVVNICEKTCDIISDKVKELENNSYF